MPTKIPEKEVLTYTELVKLYKQFGPEKGIAFLTEKLPEFTALYLVEDQEEVEEEEEVEKPKAKVKAKAKAKAPPPEDPEEEEEVEKPKAKSKAKAKAKSKAPPPEDLEGEEAPEEEAPEEEEDTGEGPGPCETIITPKNGGVPRQCGKICENFHEGKRHCGTAEKGHYGSVLAKLNLSAKASKGTSQASKPKASSKKSGSYDNLVKNITKVFQKKVVLEDVTGTEWKVERDSGLLFSTEVNEEGEVVAVVIGMLDESDDDAKCSPITPEGMKTINGLNLTISTKAKILGKVGKTGKASTPVKKAKVEEEDPEVEDLEEEEEEAPPPKSKAKAKVTPKAKAKAKSKAPPPEDLEEEEEAEDLEEEAPPKTTTKAKAKTTPKAKAKKKVEEEVEEEEVEEESPPPKSKPKAKATAKAKKVNTGEEDEVEPDIDDPDEGLAVDPEENEEDAEEED